MKFLRIFLKAYDTRSILFPLEGSKESEKKRPSHAIHFGSNSLQIEQKMATASMLFVCQQRFLPVEALHAAIQPPQLAVEPLRGSSTFVHAWACAPVVVFAAVMSMPRKNTRGGNTRMQGPHFFSNARERQEEDTARGGPSAREHKFLLQRRSLRCLAGPQNCSRAPPHPRPTCHVASSSTATMFRRFASHPPPPGLVGGLWGKGG